MDNAVTIIVGAGAVLDFDHRGIIPTVNNITEEVLELSVQKVDGGVSVHFSALSFEK